MEILTIIIIIVLAIIALKLLSMLFSGLGKILLVVLIVIVLYAVFVHASRDIIFNDYVFSDQSITVDERPFIIQFDSIQHPSAIQVKYNQNYYFVPVGTCKTIINLDFCFGNSIYDTEFGKIKVNISVYKVTPDITITRSIDKSSLVVGEETEIRVDIRNGIGLAAEQFEFIDTFDPNEFEVTGIGGDCAKENNSVVYKGTLRETKSISCKYDIKALKELERATRAKITYFDGAEVEKLFSSTINFDVEPVFGIEAYFNDSDRKVFEGEKVLFIINITNKNDEDIDDITLNISLPSGLVLEGTSSFETYFNETSNQTIRSQKITKIGEGFFQFKGELKENSAKYLALKLHATKAGLSDIFLSAEYSFDIDKYFTEKKDLLEVEHKEIIIFTNFEDAEKFDAGQQKFLKIGVSNPNENVELEDIKIKIDTNLSEITEGFVEFLEPLEAIFAINQNIDMPYVARDTTFPFNIFVSYTTEFGEQYEEDFDFDLIVESVAGLSITHDISKTTVESGEDFTVEAVIKNERNTDIKNIRVFDVVPMEFQKIGLNSISNLNINKDEDASAYRYKMIAPEVEVPTTFTFRTTARYEEDNKTYAFEKTYQIVVNPKKIDISMTRVVSDTSPFKGTILDVLYTITNPDSEETLKKIEILFPLQQDIDLVGETNFTINQLLPGESYTLRDVHRIRPKKNGSLTLAPTLFTYRDEKNNIFRQNSSKLSFDAKDGYISGPAFIIEKDSNETVFVGDLISVKITVKNVGSETGKIKINDSANSWSLQLEPKETDIITFKVKAEKEGIVNFQPAIGSYFYRNKPVFTISNAVYTNVTKIEEEKKITEGEEIKEVEIEKIAEEEAEEKTFLGKVWDAIKTILDIFGGE